jgi:4-cresol dehydrogenase (hydroxylating) flavoprotein subunit
MDVCHAWRAIVGDDNVITDNSGLKAIQKATFATEQSTIAVIRPENIHEVQSCIKIANQYKIAIYPVSGGKNWGLGSKVPVTTNCAVLDLSRLNRILDYNEKLAYIVVEPGVTFKQVANFLQENKSKLCVSAIGGHPEASLVGNTMERGDGTGPAPYGERLDHVCGFEILLPTGEIVNTGFGRFENAKTAHVSRWGVGPHFSGLFTQSNLGVVTKMTMWLMPIPECLIRYECAVENPSKLGQLLDNVQDLMLKGVIKGNSLVFWNSYKMLSSKGRYPWSFMNGKVPLHLHDLGKVEPWIGLGSIYSASREIGTHEKNFIQERIEPFTDSLNFSEVNSDSLSDPPSENHIKCTYWRKKQSTVGDMDPDRDNCGLIWLCSALPFDSQQILSIIPEIESKVREYNFEPNIGLRCVSGRLIYLLLAIIYDREIPGEDKYAGDC